MQPEHIPTKFSSINNELIEFEITLPNYDPFMWKGREMQWLKDSCQKVTQLFISIVYYAFDEIQNNIDDFYQFTFAAIELALVLPIELVKLPIQIISENVTNFQTASNLAMPPPAKKIFSTFYGKHLKSVRGTIFGHGIGNAANNCFIIASLRGLFSSNYKDFLTKELTQRDYESSEDFAKRQLIQNLLNEIHGDLPLKFCSKEKITYLRTLVAEVSPLVEGGNTQEDAHEFLSALLDVLEFPSFEAIEQIEYYRPSEEIWSEKCPKLQYKSSLMNCLTANPKENLDLSETLISDDTIEGIQVSYFCTEEDGTEKIAGTKNFGTLTYAKTFYSLKYDSEDLDNLESNLRNNLPSLMIQLKRFVYDPVQLRSKKITHPINYSPEIKVPIVQPQYRELEGEKIITDVNNIGTAHFKPSAVIAHLGSGIHSGHYVTCSIDFQENGNVHIVYNDEKVQIFVNEDEFFDFIKKNGYIFFYNLEKVTINHS
ncbi:MAG: hypothetical protein Tsb0021_00540 [Chlamydiales bacterium]